MKKLLPVCILVTSIIVLTFSAAALICMIAAVYAAPAAVIAVPAAIVSLFLCALTLPFAVLFKRDRLCFISIFIGGGALLFSAVSIVIWLVAL
ncbi:hypothetical protein [Anaerocaecibacter muris]|uniref:hypothetical protein n=1 Tax=Anaerocaecibacter muris TaxID=2941513 RepID=UPI00203F9C34|nr:hypothetical protein [Anaerocaecibacter muris]